MENNNKNQTTEPTMVKMDENQLTNVSGGLSDSFRRILDSLKPSSLFNTETPVNSSQPSKTVLVAPDSSSITQPQIEPKTEIQLSSQDEI